MGRKPTPALVNAAAEDMELVNNIPHPVEQRPCRDVSGQKPPYSEAARVLPRQEIPATKTREAKRAGWGWQPVISDTVTRETRFQGRSVKPISGMGAEFTVGGPDWAHLPAWIEGARIFRR